MGKKKRARIFLKEYRERAGLTQEALAERINKSRGQIIALENGEQRYNQDLLEEIAPFVNATPVEIISVDPTLPQAPHNPLYELVEKIDQGRIPLTERILRAIIADGSKDPTN